MFTSLYCLLLRYTLFTGHCLYMQMVCPSVRPSVRPSVCTLLFCFIRFICKRVLSVPISYVICIFVVETVRRPVTYVPLFIALAGGILISECQFLQRAYQYVTPFQVFLEGVLIHAIDVLAIGTCKLHVHVH